MVNNETIKLALISAFSGIIISAIGSPILMEKIFTPEPDDFALQIAKPSICEECSITTPVVGTSSGTLPKDKFVWIVVRPRDLLSDWYPQEMDCLSFTEEGDWKTKARLGGNGTGDIGKSYDIRAILVDHDTSKQYEEWAKRGLETGDYPPLRLMDNVRTLDQVTIKRAY